MHMVPTQLRSSTPPFSLDDTVFHTRRARYSYEREALIGPFEQTLPFPGFAFLRMGERFHVDVNDSVSRSATTLDHGRRTPFNLT